MLVRNKQTGDKVNILDFHAKRLIARGTYEDVNEEPIKVKEVENVDEVKPKTKKAKK